MKAKPPQCEKVHLAAHLFPDEFCLLAIGLDETPNALVFDEVSSVNLEEFKGVLRLYSSEYKSRVWIYQNQILEAELKGCQLNSVQGCGKPDALAIVTKSLLMKKKIQIESSLSLRRRLAEFKGENPSSQLLALFCAVERLQDRLNGTHSSRIPLVSVMPRVSTSWYRR